MCVISAWARSCVEAVHVSMCAQSAPPRPPPAAAEENRCSTHPPYPTTTTTTAIRRRHPAIRHPARMRACTCIHACAHACACVHRVHSVRTCSCVRARADFHASAMRVRTCLGREQDLISSVVGTKIGRARCLVIGVGRLQHRHCCFGEEGGGGGGAKPPHPLHCSF